MSFVASRVAPLAAGVVVGLCARGLARSARRLLSTKPATVTFETIDVFARAPFGGNPLAVCFNAETLSDADLAKVAVEFGYSETTFVLPPSDPNNTARVRIFDREGKEMPFAGHPNVGTAAALAWHGEAFGKAIGAEIRLEEIAGVVPLDVVYDDASKAPVGAMLKAPESYHVTHPSLPVAIVAACLGLEPADIALTAHPPLVGTTGLPFVVVELTSLDALGRCRGTAAGFEASAMESAPPKILAYVRTDGSEEADLRCRMLRKDGSEDAGTGSANCVLMGLLASLAPPSAGVISRRILQGVEMGRPSVLLGDATRLAGTGADGRGMVGDVRIGGECVAMSRGELVWTAQRG